MVMPPACWGPRDIRFDLECGVTVCPLHRGDKMDLINSNQRITLLVLLGLFSPKRWIMTSQEIKEAGVCVCGGWGGAECAGAGREPTTKPRIVAGGLLPTGSHPAGTRTPYDLG